MRKVLLAVIVFTMFTACTSYVTISGKVSASENLPVYISINDTINKIKGKVSHKQLVKAVDNKKLAVMSDNEGNFSIRAKPQDSLHFMHPGYFTQVHKVSDLLAKNQIHIELGQRPCIENPVCPEENYKLNAVVATKISMEYKPLEDCPNVIYLDSRYVATYKVLESVYGDYKAGIIAFNEPVLFDLKNMSEEVIRKNFPEPYFTIKDNVATAIYGNYTDEMLKIKKHILENFGFKHLK